MNWVNPELTSILNVLSLLKEKPMSYEEFLNSGCFRNKNQLNFALRRLRQASCIEKIKAIKMYVILGYGLTFLSFFPDWNPTPIDVLDIVVPIGEEREN